jgi:hypothetical protein
VDTAGEARRFVEDAVIADLKLVHFQFAYLVILLAGVAIQRLLLA